MGGWVDGWMVRWVDGWTLSVERRRPPGTQLRFALNVSGSLFGGRPLVHHCHQRAGHAGGVGMLNDVAAINDPGGALPDQFFGSLENFRVGRLAASPDQHGDGS